MVLEKNLFLLFLDIELKRARRYQNFISLLLFSIQPDGDRDISSSEGNSLRKCAEFLIDLLSTGIRESDIIGSLKENQWAILLPYADEAMGRSVKSRFEKELKYFDFKSRGYKVITEQVSFPIHGTDISELIGRLKKY